MKVHLPTGTLTGVPWLRSPNCDDRPPGVEPELIVIHNISLPPGEFGGYWIKALFTNRLDPGIHPYFTEIYKIKVSAHLLIQRDGTLTQFVPFHKRAWHAGDSCYRDKKDCNDFSIGIELEGTDTVGYEPVQYQRLVESVRALVAAYPTLSRESITGHEHISPRRKTDPGPAFDWGLLASMLQH